SDANSLEEARKKLAALLSGSQAVAPQPVTAIPVAESEEQPPAPPSLHIRPNDPRCRKLISPSISNNNTSINNNNNNIVLSPVDSSSSDMRSPSPVPPPPSVKPTDWNIAGSGDWPGPFSPIIRPNLPQTQHQQTPQHQQTQHQQTQHQQTQHQQSQHHQPHHHYNVNETRDPRRNSKSYPSSAGHANHQPQQHFTYTAVDPRIAAPSRFKSHEERPANWQASGSNGYRWTNPTYRPIPSYRGGHGGDGASYKNKPYMRPGGGAQAAAAGPSDVPRTYREHREAKARAQREVEELEAKRLRLLEAAEKEAGLERAEKLKRERSQPREETGTATPEPQLDTSYRNCSLDALSKKIDFRIPKKQAAAVSPEDTLVDVEMPDAPAAGSSKACDTDRHKNRSKPKVKKSKEKNKKKTKVGVNEKKKKIKPKGQKPMRSKNKRSKIKVRLGKITKKSLAKEAARKAALDSDSDTNSDNTDNVENEPPSDRNHSSLADKLTHDLVDGLNLEPITSESEDECDFTKSKTSVPEEENEANNNDAVAENGEEKRAETEEGKSLRTPKIKIVLGPNGHTLLVLGEGQTTPQNSTTATGGEMLMSPKIKGLQRICRRRNSMAPTASIPLFDKDELFTGRSMVYEDFQDQERTAQRQRSLAHLFEKTSDNCTVSTQNIITGKRRTRAPENFNETTLSRNSFGLGPLIRGKKADPKSQQSIATSRKRRRPANEADESQENDPMDKAEQKEDLKPEEPKKSLMEMEDVPIEQTKMNDKMDKYEPPDSPCFLQDKEQVKHLEKKEEKEEKDTVKVHEKAHADSDLEEEEAKKARLDNSDGVLDVQLQAPPQPRRKPRKKRNELDQLNEDIAQMYYGDEVLRATGRRACTRRPQERKRSLRIASMDSTSTRESAPESAHSSPAHSPVREDSPLYIGNSARRGKAFAGPRSATGTTRCKRCVVRLKKCKWVWESNRQEELKSNLDSEDEGTIASTSDKSSDLNPLKSAAPVPAATKKTTPNYMDIKNINPEWTAVSDAMKNCVVCKTSIKRSPFVHYMEKHKEHYAARLDPNMLAELRKQRGNKPDWWIKRGPKQDRHYHYVCPFCMKPLLFKGAQLAEHLSYHTGEPRFHCSHCLLPSRYQGNRRLEDHVKKCAPGAFVQINNASSRLPMRVYVCHLCQFVQISRANLERHLMQQHGLPEEEMLKIPPELLLICSLYDVRNTASTDANAIMQSNGSSTSIAAKRGDQQRKDMVKFQDMVKNERRHELDDDESGDCLDVLAKMEVQMNDSSNDVLIVEPTEPGQCDEDVDVDVLELTMPPPDEKPIVVVNECLMDVDVDGATSYNEELATNVDEATNCSDEVPPDTGVNDNITVDVKPKNLVVPDSPNGIGSDACSQRTEGESSITNEWVDMKASLGNTERSSISTNLNSFCSNLNKPVVCRDDNSTKESKTGQPNVVPDPSQLLPTMQPLEPEPASAEPEANDDSSTKETETVQANVVPDPSQLLPTMQPLEPEPASAELEANVASATAPIAQKKRIENVAYRVMSGEGNLYKRAYYCIQPGCSFLYSNEKEGLQNHFDIDHPTVQWSGKCACCPDRQAVDGMLSIKEELLHMINDHMSKECSSSEASVAPTPPVIQPKIRVRRFSGDRLTAAELATSNEQQQQQQQENVTDVEELQIEGSASDDTLTNMSLRDLLQADPRPPQQVDFNTAGVVAPEEDPAPPLAQNEPPLVINYPTNLGLSIMQVYSGSQKVGESVPTPVYVNPMPLVSPTAAAVELESELVAPAENLSGPVPDRFRCMAANCGYSSHTVMCIHEHMKFHKLSFRTDYLMCAYCAHVGTDLEDYLRHGVLVHGLGNVTDLETVVGSSSVTQQIRNVLNQRGNNRGTSGSETNAATSASLDCPVSLANEEIGLQTVQCSLSEAIGELLRPTGYSDDRLYACPQKGCIVRLAEDQFLSHVLFHTRCPGSSSTLVKCKYCKVQGLPYVIRTHLQQFHARHRVYCSVCQATAVNKQVMLLHVQQEHSEAYNRANQQLKFLPLDVAKDDNCANNECYVGVLDDPFTPAQMKSFQNKLFEELAVRRLGTKKRFRGSEVRLLPRGPFFTQEIFCAECPYRSISRSALTKHLQQHREEIVRQVYPLVDASKDVATTPASQGSKKDNASAKGKPKDSAKTVGQEKKTTATATATATPTQTTTQTPTQTTTTTPTPAPRLAKASAGPVKPRLDLERVSSYVPRKQRFACGFSLICQRKCQTEVELRLHMSGDHKYDQVLFCPHCRLQLTGFVSYDRYIQHLEIHKRHIYQCSLCPHIHPKRSFMERHINAHIPTENIGFFIHRRSIRSSNDNQNTVVTEVRWLRCLNPVTSPPNMEYQCNMCMEYFNTLATLMAHASQMHGKKNQYFCPYCPLEHSDSIAILRHVVASHKDRVLQPVETYRRLAIKNKQTIAFHCHMCGDTAISLQRISQHTMFKHKYKCQYRCPHCHFEQNLERNVANHIIQMHPNETGLAQMTFDRVYNELPDCICWNHGSAVEEEPPQSTDPNQARPKSVVISVSGPAVETAKQNPIRMSSAPHQVITEVVELDSDDDSHDSVVSQGSQERFEAFACTHCGETNKNLNDLRTQHWAKEHPDQPFYFRVQQQLLCLECWSYKGNAKTLRDDHLLRVHSIRQILACDVQQPRECAYCDYRYANRDDLVQHVAQEGHLPNDLKNVTDEDMDALQKLSSCGESAPNEYYQCDLCRVVMPTQGAMANHGNVEHSKPTERFCFRKLNAKIIYHCFRCMFTSVDELKTLRHMIDHYNRFTVCGFCDASQPGSFDSYIEHLYNSHRNDMSRFQEMYNFDDLRKYLLQVHYQFQNGLIITKSSLRYTRFYDDAVFRQIENELFSKAPVVPSSPPENTLLGQQPVQKSPMGSAEKCPIPRTRI
ncbi:hypothetical protein KR018_007730, partial [Drosophila ironensis]